MMQIFGLQIEKIGSGEWLHLKIAHLNDKLVSSLSVATYRERNSKT